METIKKGPPMSAKERSTSPFMEPGFSKQDFEKLNKINPGKQPEDEVFDVYNEFSHQTISHDFNMSQLISVPE
jgi:hypothetical protein